MLSHNFLPLLGPLSDCWTSLFVPKGCDSFDPRSLSPLKLEIRMENKGFFFQKRILYLAFRMSVGRMSNFPFKDKSPALLKPPTSPRSSPFLPEIEVVFDGKFQEIAGLWPFHPSLKNDVIFKPSLSIFFSLYMRKYMKITGNEWSNFVNI